MSDELSKLTRGTVEYNEKLFETNEEALKLLKTYDNLTYTMENGRIVIDDESLKEA
jgi:hypothetical protein